MSSERRKGSSVSRPLHQHRLLVEVLIVAAGDMEPDVLAGSLGRQAMAGLHGHVVELVRVDLNGKTFHELPEVTAELVRRMRPPPDPRISAAAAQLERALIELRGVLGRAGPSSGTEVSDAG